MELGVGLTSARPLQTELSHLGYTDAEGNPLKIDRQIGPATRSAVKKFQLDHHLAVDGTVGPKTRGALHQASIKTTDALPLSDKRNPDNAMYQQALAGAHQLDTSMGRKSDELSDNLAAAATVAAKSQGLTRIDTVAVSEDGSRTFVAQNGPFKQVVEVQTAAAVNTPAAQSAQQLQQMMPKQSDPAQTPIQTPQQATSTLSV